MSRVAAVGLALTVGLAVSDARPGFARADAGFAGPDARVFMAPTRVARADAGFAEPDARATRQGAEQLRQKVALITAHAERGSRQPRRTTITEVEVNSYLVYGAGDQIPTGVVEPSVSILGTGRLAGRAVVDLDAVRKARASASLFDPTNYLTGRLPVTATGVLKATNGMGAFQLESATVGGVPVPKLLLQEIVSYYSRTRDNPRGIGLDDPFALPAHIREIQVERGQAIIVQ